MTSPHIVIRMAMNVAEAEQLAPQLRGALDERGQRLSEQIWLRSVFMVQRGRTRIPERPAFDARCDRILEALDYREPSRVCAGCAGTRVIVSLGTVLACGRCSGSGIEPDPADRDDLDAPADAVPPWLDALAGMLKGERT